MAPQDNLDNLFNLKASFPSEEEKNAFFRAAQYNEISTLKNIIETWPEAAKKWRNYEDRPVIGATYRYLQPATLEFLVAQGADVNAPESDGSWPPLVHAGLCGDVRHIEMLLRNGADINVQDETKQTAIMMAVKENKLPSIDLLVLCGAEVYTKDKFGKSAWDRCKSDETRAVIKSAEERRRDFLAGQKAAAKSPPPPDASSAEDSDTIKLMKRLEIRNSSSAATAKSEKKPWYKIFS